MKNHVFKILLLFTLPVLMIGCKDPVEPSLGEVNLIVKFYDEAGNEITNQSVDVYLFSSAADWNAHVGGNTGVNNVGLESTSTSSVEFIGLDTIRYWVAIEAQSAGGYEISNYSGEYEIKNKLTGSATTTIKVYLRPSNSNIIAFYSTDDRFQNKPIEIYANGNQLTDIVYVSSTKPTSVNDPGVTHIETALDVIQVTWQAKSDETGCLWTGEADISDGFQFVEITDCNNGAFNFWTSPEQLALAGGRIYVVLNNTDTVGVITQGLNSMPSSCNESGVVSAKRPKGDYLYHAKGTTGCFWDGNVTINNEDCADNVELSGCE